MRNVSVLLLTFVFLSGCNFSKSVKKDLITGMTASGDKLSCEDIYLTVNDERVNRNTFIYGEKFYVKFNDITGFVKDNESVFPGLKLSITDQKNDTVFNINDLYSDSPDGVNFTPLLLSTNIVVADPMHSGKEYTLHIFIWDKKGAGTYTAKLPFRIKPNEAIAVETNSVSYNEIYLFSERRDEVITDNIVAYDENIYMIFEGLRGFKTEGNLAFPGLSLKVTDADNNSILDHENLFTEYSEKGIDPAALEVRVSSHFSLTGSGAKNPLHCTITVWDARSDARITAKADLTIK